MNKRELWDEIDSCFRAFDMYGIEVSEYTDRWNFITDIETNEIRDEGIEAAERLIKDMHRTLSDTLGFESFDTVDWV